jgi:integrase
VHPHGLRRTYAGELVREGVPIDIIRDALGHSSIAVTNVYLRRVNPQAVIETMRVRSWDVS